MNFRIIALASCVALGSIALGGKAQAQSVDVPFGGTITNTCTFGVPTTGALIRSWNLNAVEGSTGVTGFATGTAGKVTLNCTAGGSVVAAAPAPVAVPAGFTPVVRQAVVQLNASTSFTSANAGGNFNTTAAWTKPTTPLTVTAGAQTLNVAMVAGTNVAGAPPAGTYTYNVRLTATSN